MRCGCNLGIRDDGCPSGSQRSADDLSQSVRLYACADATNGAGTGFAHHPAVSLTVLLADSEGERASLLEERLREISDAVIVRVATAGNLLDAVRSFAPDVIIVDMARPDRDALDDLRRVNLDNPRPVVMFVDRDDRAFMEEAIAAGVSSYNVVNTAFPDVKPIVMAAVAIFRKYQQVSADLQRAKTRLMEREAVDKAKALLMRRRKIDEPQAYRWLRRKAMNENKRIAVVAAELLDAEGPEGSPK